LGLPADAAVLLFVGRIQPLKAPDVLLRAVARLLAARPELAERLVVAVVGGLSGSGLTNPDSLKGLTAQLGLSDLVRFTDPVPQPLLADWYRAADLTVVPSYSESFGLVAIESQACGTPVVATAVGGLRTAVRDGVSGILVESHAPDDYARVIGDLLTNDDRRRELGRGAINHATGFSWSATASDMLEVYAEARRDRERRPLAVNR